MVSSVKRLEAADYGYFRISEPSGGQGELHGRGDRPHQEERGGGVGESDFIKTDTWINDAVPIG